MTRGWAEAEASVAQEDQASARSSPSKPPRTRGAHDPRVKPASERVDWEAVENEYVWGETLSQRPDGSYVRKYPTFKQLGKKFGVAPSVVHYYAKRGNWADRRLSAIKQTKEEFDSELAKSRARGTLNVIETLDLWIEKFSQALQANKVDTSTVADLNTVARLRNFLMGGGDSRQETKVEITLEMLHQRHQQNRRLVVEAHGEVAGELAAEEDPAVTGAVVEAGA